MKANKKNLGALLLSLSLLSACGIQTVPPHTLRVGGMQAVITHMDPHREWDGWFIVRYGAGETLFRLDEALTVKPWLAQSYERIDSRTWCINLREGVHFSNGLLMTADKVVASLERSAKVNPRAKSLQGARYKIDGNRIFIHTPEPQPTLINDLTDPYTVIIDVNEPVGEETAPITTAPYRIVDYVLNDHVKLEANPYYWGGSVGAQEVEFVQVRDMTTLEMALQTGELDIAQGLTAEVASLVSLNPHVQVTTTAQPRAYILYFNMERIPDEAVRKALLYSIDRQAMQEGALKGALTPAAGPFLPSTDYGDKRDLADLYDLQKAASLLEGAGYHKNETSGLWEKDGQPLTVHLDIYKRYASLALATELQSQWRKAGIHVVIDQHENEAYFKKRDFEMGLYTMITMPTGSPYEYLRDLMSTGGQANFGGYSNPLIDQELATLQEDPNAKEAPALVETMLAQAEADGAYGFLGFNNLIMGLNRNIAGYHPWPIDYYQMNNEVRRKTDDSD